jgi:hypothetical protein
VVEREEYRIMQDGEMVAKLSGPKKTALPSILHYAMMYGQDGPVRVERREGRKWLEVCLKPGGRIAWHT